MIVTQTFPVERQAPLERLYLAQRLAEIPPKIGRSLVFANFLTDRKGVIAKADEGGNFQVPAEIKNASDWQLFQELMAQADVIISGAAYLKRAAALGENAQNILSQFEAGGEFESLGEWRLRQGYRARSPGLAVVTHSLDIIIPAGVLKIGGRLTVFTTRAAAGSPQARELQAAGVGVIGSGEEGVDGDTLIDALSGLGYGVIQMATGPRVLDLLLAANRLDRLYITEAQVELSAGDPAAVQTVLPVGKKVNQLPGFHLAHRYLQEGVATTAGRHIAQEFLRYDRQG